MLESNRSDRSLPASARSFSLRVARCFAIALAGAALLAGCKSKSSPTQPVPPAPAAVLLLNQSSYFALVAAGTSCTQSDEIEPDGDDFSAIDIDFELSCAAVEQGEGHSGNIDVDGFVEYEHEAQGGGWSGVRFAVEAIANRSPTGLASSGAVNWLRIRFEVRDAPLEWRAEGEIRYADHFADFVILKPVGGAPGSELLEVYGMDTGDAGVVDIDATGTLQPGVYELQVRIDTHDWFTEEAQFHLEFPSLVIR